jgi:hypothetical protein
MTTMRSIQNLVALAARSHAVGEDSEDYAMFEPMRAAARVEPRRAPSTDEKKIKRQIQRKAVSDLAPSDSHGA